MRNKRTKNTISYNMSRIKAKGTAIEKALTRSLKKHKLVGYKNNDNKILGIPDITWKGHRVAVFCDSSFWHGYKKMTTSRHNFKSNRKFWLQKIRRNMDRDREVNRLLRNDGWNILRFWDFQIEGNVDKCVIKIKKALRRKK